MDFLNGNIKPMYFKYLSAAFGSAMISSVYSIVDTAMVGQYHGPQGTAALAVVAPVWNIIYSLGLLVGIGGSVIFSTRRGSGKSDGSEHQYFTAAVIGAVLLSVLAWIGVLGFQRPVLTFFGADEALLALAQSYMRPIQYAFLLSRFSCSISCWRRFCGMTMRRGWRPSAYCPAASLTSLAITSSSSPVIWGSTARDWQPPSAPAFRFL